MDEGDKILLPPSALEMLARMNVEYPMLFELRNDAIEKKTHCGVMEFSAEEGRCYMPFWMMQNMLVSRHFRWLFKSHPLFFLNECCIITFDLSSPHLSLLSSSELARTHQLEEGQLISVKNVSLPKATFVKFRAQSCDFLEITNHRAVLEVTLRKFTCLTEGDQICIAHGGANYFLDIREVKPNGAASIIETDCNVDFEEPVGYKAWEESKAQERASGKASGKDDKSTSGGPVISRTLQRARVVSEEETAAAKNAFKPFAGSAKRIDGRQVSSSAAEGKDSKESGKDSSSSSSSGAKDAPYGGAGSSSASASAGAGGASVAAAAVPAGPSYQSRIGDKFSKKKAVLTAMKDPTQKFAGPANTLAGKGPDSSGSTGGSNTLGHK